MKRILLLGGTGRTGKLVLSYALEKGYHVNVLARKTNRISAHKNLNVIDGNPTNRNELENALVNCDAVINVLNISRTSDFPWARLRTPKILFQIV